MEETEQGYLIFKEKIPGPKPRDLYCTVDADYMGLALMSSSSSSISEPRK